MNEMKMDLSGVRIADDKIYLSEDRRAQPKDCFKDSLKFINTEKLSTNPTWLDIGCATGDYINFLQSQFSSFNFIGLDISEAMINEASSRDPRSIYKVGDVRDSNSLPKECADIITIFGVIDCFDEIYSTFNSLMKWVKPNGLILILDIINPLPIDAIMRYRRVSEINSPWESGWNTYSFHTIEHELKKYDQIESFDFVPFEISTDLPRKNEDPMRTWTIKTETKDRQLINGVGQMVNLHFVPINIK